MPSIKQIQWGSRLVAAALLALSVSYAPASAAEKATAKAPLKIAYSDWPGWVAWEVAIQKDWFKQKGVAVEFAWFDYVASMDAFSAGKVDAVTVTNGDALVMGAAGGKSVVILINDYSNGNDMVVAKPGFKSLKDLKGKKIGVEIGFVDHLLLLEGLKKNGLSEADVTLVNMPTNEAAQVLASGDVDAVAAWQPNSGMALKQVAGSKSIYSSADAAGLIFDTLAVKPESLSARQDDWKKVIEVWYQIVAYLADPKTKADGIKIMASRAGVAPEEYEKLLAGTRILSLDEAIRYATKGDGFGSIYGSSKISDDFQVANKVYAAAQPIDSYFDFTLLRSLKK